MDEEFSDETVVISHWHPRRSRSQSSLVVLDNLFHMER